jgi:RNA polymerase sigma-70 factor
MADDFATLDNAWREAYEAGAKAWVDIDLGYELYLRHVVQFGHAKVPMHAKDLYLAAAVRYQLPSAHHVFEVTQIRPLIKIVVRIMRRDEAVQDVLHEFRRRVFLGPLPQIRSFCGRVPLQSWTRRSAIRLAVNRMRSEAARRQGLVREGLPYPVTVHAPADNDLNEVFHPREYGHLCGQAIASALTAVAEEDRRLLYNYYVGRLSVDALGSLYGVDRCAISRRIRRLLGLISERLDADLLARFPVETTGRRRVSNARPTCEAIRDPEALPRLG